MKFIAALASTVLVARAVRDPEGSQQSAGGKSFDIGGMYRAPDYSQDYGEALPGADFNKQVYQFRENEQIWDQNDYVERVRAEAEMLVALEALKTSVGYLRDDTHTLVGRIAANHASVGVGHDDAYADQAQNVASLYDSAAKVHAAGDLCRLAASDLADHKNALILYCQQFAFGSEMVPACAAILTCKDTELPYRYNFTGGSSYGTKTSNDNSGGYDEVVDDHDHYEDHAQDHTHDHVPSPHTHVNSLPDKEPSHNFDDYLPKNDEIKPRVSDYDGESSHGFKLHVTGDGLKEG